MQHWHMVTLIGEDRPGIVAGITRVLFDAGCTLGEASMMRLGGNFTIMLMARCDRDAESLRAVVEPVARSLGLRAHVDPIEGRLHRHVEPDVHVTVSGADRAGIVAETTGALFEAGLDILNLESDVAGSVEEPIYVMHIEGRALGGIDPLRVALAGLRDRGIDATLTRVESFVG